MLKMPLIISKLNIQKCIPCTKQAFLIFNPPFIRVNPSNFTVSPCILINWIFYTN